MKNEVKTPTNNTEMVTITRAEYEKLQAQGQKISALEKQIEQLMEAIRLSRKKQFGVSSEKLKEDGYKQMSLLFNEAEVYLPVPEKQEKTAVAAYTRQKRSTKWEEELPENVPVEVVEHRMSEEERKRPAAMRPPKPLHISWCRNLSWPHHCTDRSRSGSSRA